MVPPHWLFLHFSLPDECDISLLAAALIGCDGISLYIIQLVLAGAPAEGCIHPNTVVTSATSLVLHAEALFQTAVCIETDILAQIV